MREIFLLSKQIANICGDKLGLSILTGLHAMYDYIFYQETCNPQDMTHFGMVLSKFFPKVSKQ